MGGLFSSNDPPAQHESHTIFTPTTPQWSSYSTSSSNSRSTYSDNYDYTDFFNTLENIARIANDPRLLLGDTNDVQLPSEQITPCAMFNYYNSSDVVSYTLVDDFQIKRMIKNRRIKIDKILKVHNQFLEKSYRLKNEEKSERFGYGLEERLLFHGTSLVNAINICENNFDWRLCGRHKFGKGVSFSTNAKYASEYSDQTQCQKVMIVAKVSVFQSHGGNRSTILPRDGYDTTNKNGDDIVQVKYEDAEFCPVFLIYYHLTE